MANQHLKETAFVVFDFETLNPQGGAIEPIELGAAVLEPGFVRRPDKDFSRFIKPPAHVPFTSFTTWLTGITPEHLSDAPSASAVMTSFNDSYCDKDYVFVAHHAPYDYGILRNYAECDTVLKQGYIDTVKLAKHLLPELRSRKLDSLAEYFQLPLPKNRHRALADCILTADVLIELLQIAMQRGIFSTDQLFKIAAVKHPTPKPTPQTPLFS